MKTVIWKFPCQPGRFALDLPKMAFVLHIANQIGQGVQMWVQCEPDQPKEIRKFRIVATGEEFDGRYLTFMGTFLINGGVMVFHLYEESGD